MHQDPLPWTCSFLRRRICSRPSPLARKSLQVTFSFCLNVPSGHATPHVPTALLPQGEPCQLATPGTLRWAFQRPNGLFSCLFKESHTGRKTRNSTFKLGYSWPLLNPGREPWPFITIHLTDFQMEWTGLFIKAIGKPSGVTQVIKCCYLMSEKRATFQYACGEFCVFFQWALFCENQLKGRGKSSPAFSLQPDQGEPSCPVGGWRQIGGLRSQKWGVPILVSCFLESPPPHQLQNILFPDWTCLQSRNRVTDVESKFVVMKKDIEVGRNTWGDWDWHLRTIKYNR